jgi:Putative transmembrane protein (PGPGW)
MTESVSVWSTQPSGSLWRTAGGWSFLVFGVAGLVLPVLPGVPLLLAGLIMLSADHHWARSCLRRVKLWIRKLNRHRSGLANALRSCRDPKARSTHGTRLQPQQPRTTNKGEYHHETGSQ